MSVLTLGGSATSAPPILPRPKRWTVAEFHRLWEQGWFERSRPMLLDGEIYEMAIPGPRHNTGVGLADYALKAVFAVGYWVRVQMPLVLSQWSDPVPDLAVLTGSVRDYVATQPTTAVLVVEVADTSLSTDTGEKARLYAAAGIADYWVVDLNSRTLIVHRDPHPDPASPHGASYQTATALAPGQSAAPLAAPQAVVNVADLLP
ncbi:MAG TPA: Uma2 family endonuclease [Gemmataceae bacterium]|nr:Uma2 family endonuclease [Gemmataceae bacterium]